jgi:hypothetical protein
VRNRFFAAVVRWGGFHVGGIADDGPWDRMRLKYRWEGKIDLDFDPAAGDRKIKTAVELLATTVEAMVTRATRNVWIHESLEGEAKSFWEKFSNNRLARFSNQLN